MITGLTKNNEIQTSLKQGDLTEMIKNILGMISQGAQQAAVAPVALEEEVQVQETDPGVVAADTSRQAPEGPMFTIQPVLGSLPRVVIEHNELRKFFLNDTDTDILNWNCLEESTDAPGHKEVRRRMATKSVKDFFGILPELKTYSEDSFVNGSNVSTITYAQLQEFIAAVQGQYDSYYSSIKEAIASGNISFSDLSLYMADYKGFVVFDEGDTTVFGKVHTAEVKMSMMGPYLQVRYEVYFNSHEGLAPTKVAGYVMGYNGTKTFKEIGLRLTTETSDEFQQFVARGERYLKLTSGPAYVQCAGEQVYKTYWSQKKFNANGRFVVDFRGMKRADSNYDKYFGYAGRNSDERTKVQGMDTSKVSDVVKASCVPFLYGFSLKAKQWGEIHIDQVSNIEFRKDAYDKLVLDKDLKELIFAQVEDKNPQKEADLIDGKGGGCIFLLAGTPGLGKTLTAEAVAEKLQRPLYTVSVGELGTSVSELEENLRDILETATEWNAILLIDEADIFLEARTDADIERNAMVAVFLRLLEYYQGILFLTTNRAANLDEAFFSRISLAIHYPKLSYKDRTKIWANLLSAAGINTVGLDIHALAENELNGRQIKHVIKTAGAMARFKGRLINSEDFSTIIGKQNEFRAYVDSMNVIEGTGTLIKEPGCDSTKSITHVVEVPKQGYFRRLISAIFGK